MSKTKYRQCNLEKPTENGKTTTVSYLPEKYAVVGRVLKLKDIEGSWIDGWVVMTAGALTDEPPDYRRDIRGHRNRTGDSLPKMRHMGD